MCDANGMDLDVSFWVDGRALVERGGGRKGVDAMQSDDRVGVE